MRFRAEVLMAVLLALAGTIPLTGQTPEQMQQEEAPPLVVQVKLVEGRIVADPDPVEVELGGRIRWTVESQKDDQISVAFDAQRGVPGPFAPVGETSLRGRYAAVGPGSIDTGVADQLPVDAMGKRLEYQEWKYSITWKSGSRTMTVDPIIRVKGGGG